MSNLHRHLSIAVLLSEFSHVFCCILPTVFTVLSFAANLGMITVLPGFLLDLHENIHHYEIHIIAFSGAMLLLGWGTHMASRRVDCHDDGCCHPPCTPQKSANKRILVIASILFLLNVGIYLFVHKNVFGLAAFEPTAATAYAHLDAK